jgi:hypothetical protein
VPGVSPGVHCHVCQGYVGSRQGNGDYHCHRHGVFRKNRPSKPNRREMMLDKLKLLLTSIVAKIKEFLDKLMGKI